MQLDAIFNIVPEPFKAWILRNHVEVRARLNFMVTLQISFKFIKARPNRDHLQFRSEERRVGKEC